MKSVFLSSIFCLFLLNCSNNLNKNHLSYEALLIDSALVNYEVNDSALINKSIYFYLSMQNNDSIILKSKSYLFGFEAGMDTFYFYSQIKPILFSDSLIKLRLEFNNTFWSKNLISYFEYNRGFINRNYSLITKSLGYDKLLVFKKSNSYNVFCVLNGEKIDPKRDSTLLMNTFYENEAPPPID